MKDLDKPVEDRYVHQITTTPSGRSLIFTFDPYLLSLIHTATGLHVDTTFKQAASDHKEVEFAVWVPAVQCGKFSISCIFLSECFLTLLRSSYHCSSILKSCRLVTVQGNLRCISRSHRTPLWQADFAKANFSKWDASMFPHWLWSCPGSWSWRPFFPNQWARSQWVAVGYWHQDFCSIIYPRLLCTWKTVCYEVRCWHDYH